MAGEPYGAFWTVAPAALAPPQWRLVAYGGALAFGAAVGLLRIAGGGHFFSDVMFAGVLMYLMIWVVHGLIFRWRNSRRKSSNGAGRLAAAGEAIRNGLRVWVAVGMSRLEQIAFGFNSIELRSPHETGRPRRELAGAQSLIKFRFVKLVIWSKLAG